MFRVSDDWAKHTVYEGYESSDDVIQWFWQCVRRWSSERRSCLLSFTTGSPRVSIKGFQELRGRFTVLKSEDLSKCPKGHTGFNRIDLPPYKDYVDLEQRVSARSSISGRDTHQSSIADRKHSVHIVFPQHVHFNIVHCQFVSVKRLCLDQSKLLKVK